MRGLEEGGKGGREGKKYRFLLINLFQELSHCVALLLCERHANVTYPVSHPSLLNILARQETDFSHPQEYTASSQFNMMAASTNTETVHMCRSVSVLLTKDVKTKYTWAFCLNKTCEWAFKSVQKNPDQVNYSFKFYLDFSVLVSIMLGFWSHKWSCWNQTMWC